MNSGSRYDLSDVCLVPFEEDAKAPDVWYIDHDYLSNMFAMFRKVNGAFI